MVHLRNGTPEHRTEYHLLLSDLILFDQNNCHLHRYHQFCHLRWRLRHSPSHQGFFGFKGGISGSDQMRTISSEKITHGAPSQSSPYSLLYATDILFTYLDILTPANLSADTKIAWFSRVGSSIINVPKRRSRCALLSDDSLYSQQGNEKFRRDK